RTAPGRAAPRLGVARVASVRAAGPGPLEVARIRRSWLQLLPMRTADVRRAALPLAGTSNTLRRSAPVDEPTATASNMCSNMSRLSRPPTTFKTENRADTESGGTDTRRPSGIARKAVTGSEPPRQHHPRDRQS